MAPRPGSPAPGSHEGAASPAAAQPQRRGGGEAGGAGAEAGGAGEDAAGAAGADAGGREGGGGGGREGGDFYLRFYAGRRGHFGHEFIEFELRRDGRLRYVNQSGYHGGGRIRREAVVSQAVVREARRLVEESGVMQEDDREWPEPDNDGGRQELEVAIGEAHISFITAETTSAHNIHNSRDPGGLAKLYHAVGDLKALIHSLFALHFKKRPTI